MEFGRVSDDQLKHIQFELPADPLFNQQIIKGKKAAQPKLYIGCAKWGANRVAGEDLPA